MKQIIILWMGLLLLVAWRATGQETDSLFFRPDSLPKPLMDGGNETCHIDQQRAAAESFMTSRIHFTNDFIRRFTGQTGGSTGSKANGTPLCETRLRLLFDGEDVRFNRRTSGSKGDYAALTDQFIAAVCGSQPSGVPTDPNEQLYAEVLVQVTEQQHHRELKIYLKKGRTGVNWAWEVIGADAAFELPDADTPRPTVNHRDSLAFIAPNAHELNFMGWAKQLRAGSDLGQFIHPASAGNQLTAIARSLATGQLRLQTLHTTALWLNTQLGWVVQLRQFNRETDNSGWLISDLCRLDETTGLPPVLHRFMTTNAIRKP